MLGNPSGPLNLIPSYVSWYKKLIANILCCTWFQGLDLPRQLIVVYSRVHFGYNLLPNHSFRLFFNLSPLCSLHHDEIICNLYHILFYYLYLTKQKSLSLPFPRLFFLWHPTSQFLLLVRFLLFHSSLKLAFLSKFYIYFLCLISQFLVFYLFILLIAVL